MVRQVVLTIPTDKVDGVVVFIKSLDHVHNLCVFRGDMNTMITFCGTDTKAGVILKSLHDFGIGTDYGYTTTMATQSVSPFVVDFQRAQSREKLEAESKQTRYKSDLADRLPVEEIYSVIAQGNKLNFDYVIMTFVAGVIASIGLLTDNLVVLVASMLLSPLMGPILGLTFGVILRDKTLVKRSLINEAVGVFVSILTGVITAACIVWVDLDKFPTKEMSDRGELIGLITGLAIAVPSGAGVALAVTSGAVNPLVGVAISASVLPPLANAGVSLVLGLAKNDKEMVETAVISLVLWAINCMAIFFVSLTMFHIKRVRIESRYKGSWKDRNSVTMPNLASDEFADTAMIPAAQFGGPATTASMGAGVRGSQSSIMSQGDGDDVVIDLPETSSPNNSLHQTPLSASG